MATELSVILGSGLNPLKQFVPLNPVNNERWLKGTSSVIINPEDFSAGGSGLVTPLSLTGTAIRLPTTPLEYRRAISVSNNNTVHTIFIGFDPALTSSTGFPILPEGQLSMDINAEVILYGVTGGPTINVRVLELR